MKMEPEIKKNYQVKLVEEDTKPVEPERLEEDPLENLPDLSSRTGGLPIVTFVLICLSAGIIMLIARVLTAESVAIAAGCIVFEDASYTAAYAAHAYKRTPNVSARGSCIKT